MNRVPFSLPDVGLREIRGLAFVDDEFLVLRIENSFAGLADKKTHVIKMLPSALEEVSVRRGLASDRLIIRPKRSELLDIIPGQHASALELKVKKKHGADLERVLSDYRKLCAVRAQPE
jgi:hypothetical protein